MALVHVSQEITIASSPEKIGKTLFNVDLFQRYLADVKEVEILERDPIKGRQQTRWKVEIEGVELEWFEEEQLDLRHGRMQFRLLRGDFKEFAGTWDFSRYEGIRAAKTLTRVSLAVEYDLGLPAFEDLIGHILKHKLTHNSANLLVALKTSLEGGTP